MRDYAKVAPQFWTGRTGKALKAAGPEAVIVGMYLMTSPHANMIGVYHCPVAYISIDTGLTLEGASKGLASAIEADFCTFDESCDYVFVHEFAAYQIGDELNAGDNRVKGVINELSKVPKGQCWQGFRARYAVPFKLPVPANQQPKHEAPSKPLRSQEQEQEQKQEDLPSGPARGEGRFPDFWKAWPSTDRKQDRKKCVAKWVRCGFDVKADVIVAHVNALKATKKWKDGFEPAPLTYLNGERWADGVEAPEAENIFAGAL